MGFFFFPFFTSVERGICFCCQRKTPNNVLYRFSYGSGLIGGYIRRDWKQKALQMERHRQNLESL
jgi:hypothetical protein